MDVNILLLTLGWSYLTILGVSINDLTLKLYSLSQAFFSRLDKPVRMVQVIVSPQTNFTTGFTFNLSGKCTTD
jgi:hypothetical protein